jgi:hypothetical protein
LSEKDIVRVDDTTNGTQSMIISPNQQQSMYF